jgi:site-specific DNA-methyltransferase (adenine-specific)
VNDLPRTDYYGRTRPEEKYCTQCMVNYPLDKLHRDCNGEGSLRCPENHRVRTNPHHKGESTLKFNKFPYGKKYSILYVDPPYQYRDKVYSGKRGVHWKYDTLTMQDIRELPVESISAKDAWLFLWVPCPLIREEADYKLIENWGFEYKTVAFVWVKMNKKSPNPFIGMGNFSRANVELCLLATRGNVKRKSASVHQIIFYPRQGLRHSEKPAVVRDKIVELCGNMKRIELFARPPIPKGWDYWGSEGNKY